MTRLRILAVDDDPVTLAIFSKRLKEPDYLLDTETDGNLAIERMKQRCYDVIITDLIMPGSIDGIAVLHAAKTIQPLAEVLLLTAHASVESAVEAMRQGAFDYLQKPINFDELFHLLDRITDLKRLHQDSVELRQAMDTTERRASETIGRLEIEVSRMSDILEKVKSCLLHDDASASEKVAQITVLLNACKDPPA